MSTGTFRHDMQSSSGAGRGTRGCAVNVGDPERMASILGGAALTVYGLARGRIGGLGLAALGGTLIYRGFSGHCPLYQSLGWNTAGQHGHGRATSVPANQGFKVEKKILVRRKPEDVYAFWRRLENLPRVMRHLETVTMLGDRRSHWVARGPAGQTAEWDAEIINERPNELIAWRSLPGSQVDTAGSVHFQRGPVGQETEIQVTLKYDPPLGKVGAAVARLFGEDPEAQIIDDLRNFKRMMESGELEPRSLAGRTSR